MELNNIINEIENGYDDVVDRCSEYTKRIIYLKSLKTVIGFKQENENWQNDINKVLLNDIHNSIDDGVNKLKSMFMFNVKKYKE